MASKPYIILSHVKYTTGELRSGKPQQLGLTSPGLFRTSITFYFIIAGPMEHLRTLDY